jgi:ubiquinone biosynthesis protein COQ4
MNTNEYEYSSSPTKNPFRYLLAVWRLMSWDSDDAITEEAAIVEIGFARSRLGRRLSRWDDVLAQLRQDPVTAQAIDRRSPCGPIDLDRLQIMTEGSLGEVFASHCRNRGINPNLVHIAPEGDEGWLLNHLYQTHDIWHVVTGWPNDVRGEIGLGGFYCGQLRSPAFFTFMLSLLLLKTVLRKEPAGPLLDAFVEGYRSGRSTDPLLATAWDEMWEMPLSEVRKRVGITGAAVDTMIPAQAA